MSKLLLFWDTLIVDIAIFIAQVHCGPLIGFRHCKAGGANYMFLKPLVLKMTIEDDDTFPLCSNGDKFGSCTIVVWALMVLLFFLNLFLLLLVAHL